MFPSARLAPGIADFAQTVTGSYKAHGQRVTITATLASPNKGSFVMKIEPATFGTALSISTMVVIDANSADPVYVSIVGA